MIKNNQYMKKQLNIKNYPIELNHVNSLNFKGLQVADLISWSTFQAFENENDKFIKTIENKHLKIICED